MLALKPGDKNECMRLACSIAAAVVQICHTRLQIQVNPLEISGDVADCITRFYKADIRSEQIHGLAFKAGSNTSGTSSNHNE